MLSGSVSDMVFEALVTASADEVITLLAEVDSLKQDMDFSRAIIAFARKLEDELKEELS